MSAATLTDAEAHHALHVLRVKVGDNINLFDGCGTTASGVVESASRREVVVTIRDRTFLPRSENGEVVVAASPPKGDRLKWMLEKLTELGVGRYIPLTTERSVVDPGKSKFEKLKATIVSAAKQCGRNWLMEIDEPTDVEMLLSNSSPNQTLHIAHPYPLKSANGSANPADSQIVLIGPEGGFTNQEVELAVHAGAIPLSWPGSVLRVETAAIMAAVLLQSRIEETNQT